MTDGTLTVYLAQHPIFKGLKQEQIAFIGGLAQLVRYQPQQHVFEHDNPANNFFIVRDGTVTVEIPSVDGEPLVIQKLGNGSLLGWSWLIPPYRWAFDARASLASEVIVIDGAKLRAACDADHDLGYELLKRFAALMADRLNSARRAAIQYYTGS